MTTILIPGSNPASVRFPDAEVINGRLYVAGKLVDEATARVPRPDAVVTAQQTPKARRRAKDVPVDVLNGERQVAPSDASRIDFLILAGGTWQIARSGAVSRPNALGHLDPEADDEPCWWERDTGALICWKGEEKAALRLDALSILLGVDGAAR